MRHRDLLGWCVVLVLSLGLLAGCGEEETDEDQEYREAIVNPDDLTLSTSEANALLAALEQGLEAQTLRAAVVERVQATNDYLRVLFGKLEAFRGTEPSRTGKNFRIWGPATDEGVEYFFAVQRSGLSGVYHYALTARAAGTAGKGKAVLWGALKKVGPYKGRGRVWLAFDRMKTIKPDFAFGGGAWLHFENLLPVKKVTIGFKKFTSPEQPEELTAFYQYGRTGTGLHGFRFVAHTDVLGGAAKEKLAVRAGWVSAGAGRAAGALWGGDVAAGRVVARECWDDAGAVVFRKVEPDQDPPLSMGSVDQCPTAEGVAADFEAPADEAAAAGEVSEDIFDIADLPTEAEANGAEAAAAEEG